MNKDLVRQVFALFHKYHPSHLGSANHDIKVSVTVRPTQTD